MKKLRLLVAAALLATSAIGVTAPSASASIITGKNCQKMYLPGLNDHVGTICVYNDTGGFGRTQGVVNYSDNPNETNASWQVDYVHLYKDGNLVSQAGGFGWENPNGTSGADNHSTATISAACPNSHFRSVARFRVKYTNGQGTTYTGSWFKLDSDNVLTTCQN